MPNLLVGPQAVTAKAVANLADLFTVDNCLIIYEANGSFRSYVPGRDLNAFTETVDQRGYIVYMKTGGVDASAVFDTYTNGFEAGLLSGAVKSLVIGNNTGADIHIQYRTNTHANIGAAITIPAGGGYSIRANQLPDTTYEFYITVTGSMSYQQLSDPGDGLTPNGVTGGGGNQNFPDITGVLELNDFILLFY